MKSETWKDSGVDLALFVRRHPWLTAFVVTIATCVTVFFCLEWSAEQRWQGYAKAARARGVKLLLTDFARPEVPDEQNFAALPVMRSAMALSYADTHFQLPSASGKGPGSGIGYRPPGFGDSSIGQGTNWASWQSYLQAAGFLKEVTDNPPRDVLRAIERFAPEIREWREWRTRPYCRFPLDLTKGASMPQPHLRLFQWAARVFGLRMRAHLAMGDSSAAYEDFQDAFQAYRALREEPSLICSAYRVGNLHMLLAGVGDGLRDRVWSPADLARIEADLSTIRLWDDRQLALASERGVGNTSTESWLYTSMWKRGEMAARSISFGSSGNLPRNQEIAFQFCPRMVFRDNQLRKNRYLDELLARIDTEHQTFDPDSPTPSDPQLIRGGYPLLYYYLFVYSSLDGEWTEKRYVATQIALDEVRLAGALERFRAKYGAYPANLTELTPEFLAAIPIDLYTPAPYRYQRVGVTSFRVYSVGRNQQDDGGAIMPNVPEEDRLDIVWPYSPPVAP